MYAFQVECWLGSIMFQLVGSKLRSMSGNKPSKHFFLDLNATEFNWKSHGFGINVPENAKLNGQLPWIARGMISQFRQKD